MYKYIINRILSTLPDAFLQMEGVPSILRAAILHYNNLINDLIRNGNIFDLHCWENSGSIPFHSVIQQTVLMQSLQCTDSWVTNFACIEPHITLYQFDLPPEFGFRCLWRMAQSPNSLCNSLLFIVL